MSFSTSNPDSACLNIFNLCNIIPSIQICVNHSQNADLCKLHQFQFHLLHTKTCFNIGNPSDWEIALERWKLNLLRIEATLTVIPEKPLDRPLLILVPNLEKDECDYCCHCWNPSHISDWYMAS